MQEAQLLEENSQLKQQSEVKSALLSSFCDKFPYFSMSTKSLNLWHAAGKIE